MKKTRVFGIVNVPGMPPARITNKTVATYIAAQQHEIARLSKLLAEREPSRIVLPS